MCVALGVLILYGCRLWPVVHGNSVVSPRVSSALLLFSGFGHVDGGSPDVWGTDSWQVAVCWCPLAWWTAHAHGEYSFMLLVLEDVSLVEWRRCRWIQLPQAKLWPEYDNTDQVMTLVMTVLYWKNKFWLQWGLIWQVWHMFCVSHIASSNMPPNSE